MTSTPAPEPTRIPRLGESWTLPTAGATSIHDVATTARPNRTISILAILTAALGLYIGAGGPLHYLTPTTAAQRIALYTAAAAALALLVNVLAGKARGRQRPASGQIAVTIGAFVCTAVGVNTAWGFTHTHLGITDTFTRIALCGTGEIVLISLGLAARDNFRRDKAAGMPGVLVWLITGFLAVPAFAEGAAMANTFWAGLVAGAWRAVFGPIGAAILWHFAMGLEIRAADATARSMGVLARLGRRIGQKVLAAFGIADTDTTTTELLRQRARVQAANLTDRYDAISAKKRDGWRGRWIRRRLRAALRAANVAHDERQKAALLADLAISSHAPTLTQLAHENPWGLATKSNPSGDSNGDGGASSDRQNSDGQATDSGDAGARKSDGDRQKDRQDEQRKPPVGGGVSAKSTGGKGSGDANKDRQNSDKKKTTTASTRRPMDEWVKLAGPVFHAEFRQRRRQPTGPEFAAAIANAGLGKVSDSTAKNIRQAVLDNEKLPTL